MFRFAFKSILAKKLRLLSTALSVTLGVAFLAGTLVFGDTIRRTFDNLFADIYEETDSVVRASNSVDVGMGWSQRGRIPESVEDLVWGVPGVVDAQAVVQGFAQIVGTDGKAVGNPGQGAPTFGQNYFAGGLAPWRLTPGSHVPHEGQVVIDPASARAGDIEIGDRITILTQTGPHQFDVVGFATFGSVDSPGGASVSLFDMPTAQQVLLGGTGMIDAVMVDGAADISEEELTARISAVLPYEMEALTGAEVIDEAQDGMRTAFSFFNTFLMVFAAIGLVVAAFTIYNTFQIVVTQRIREMALLRSVGATRRQVLAGQLLEAVLIGLVASLVGLLAGVAVAVLLQAMLAAFGIDIPGGGMVFVARTAIISMVVGTVVTVGSAVFPSLRASRVPPLAAIRDVRLDQSAQSRNRLIQGGAVGVAGVVAFAAGLTQGQLLWVGVGALLVFIGVFTLGPLFARPTARLLGLPLPALAGITGSLARQNAMRNPKRTARTGGALMVGVALVAAITVIAASAKDWVHDVFGEQFTGDFVVSTNIMAFGGISPELAAQVNELPEVEAAAGIRVGAARITSGTKSGDYGYIAVDPVRAGTVFDIGMTVGSVEGLTDDGVLLSEDEARSRGLGVGDPLDFTFLNGVSHRLTVQGLYTGEDLAGQYVVSHALHEASGADQFDFSVYITKAPGVSDTEARAAIGRVSDAYPNADLQSREEYVQSQAAQVDQLVNLMYGLLGLAVIIALISIANSIGLSIHERTHELGLLRAVGMTRGQTRASVRWEAMLIALFGAGLGVILGVFFGWSISVTMREDGGLGTFVLPVVPIVVVAALAVLGGMIAAIRPAWRAARLDVLRAVTTE